jgi:glycosyltransferase involved in cell wall biosynthesis
MRISVVVPHLNQEEYLRICLEALHAQTGIEGHELEIIVVDNGSRRLPEAVCAAWGDVTLLSESTPGPGPARNRGAGAASGDILAFIDADCRAEPGWLAAIVSALAWPDRPIIGGDVRVGYATPGKPTFLEPYENIYSYRNHEHIRDGFSGTGNLATFPAVLEDVGPFGGIDISEDRDWGLRAGAKGYSITYVPEMIIYHPARKSFAELTLKWDRHIAHDYEMILPKRFGALRWLLRASAIAVSPVFELRTIATSPRVSGLAERGLAFLCLGRVRLYRAGRMVQVLLRGDGRTISGAWNRE